MNFDISQKEIIDLLNRNKKRLLLEIKQSKELMNLIAKSTSQELTDEEWKKMKEQLLDVFKTIPAFAIFMLPGGMLLLPLVVKYIPQLMPSAFSSNPDKDEDES